MSVSFADLNLDGTLLQALDACGYVEPTPIQAQAIPAALSGRDLIATANTGTGKTAAFVLPALQRLRTPRPNAGFGPRIVVLSPTRELASQIMDAVRKYSKFHRVRTGVILGGMPYREQIRVLSRQVDLIVATPGRLIDHLERGRLDLGCVETLILDEADRMLDMGFIEPVEQIAAACPAERQTLLFTATFDARMTRLSSRLLREPERIDIAGREISHDAIEQRLIQADDLGHKHRLLDHFVASPEVGKVIVFAATKRDADRLATDLVSKGHAAAALHGDMKQHQRNRTVEALRRGRVQFLVATDVAARGIDVADVTHVINFDLPRAAEDYVHRIGRTGRAGATGTAVSFFTRAKFRMVRTIEAYIGRSLETHVVPGLEPTERPRPRPAGRPKRMGPPSGGKEGPRGDRERDRGPWRADGARNKGPHRGGADRGDGGFRPVRRRRPSDDRGRPAVG